MKRVLYVIIFVVSFFSPLNVQAEEILSLESDISIEKSGIFHVSEIIEYDFGNKERHGIFRTIPYEKTNEKGEKYRLDIAVSSVVDERDKAYDYAVSNEGKNKKLKIGNPDVYVRGKKIFRLSYTVGGGITYFSDHDELYWNTVGTDWTVPIRTAKASVTLPENIHAGDIKMSCFVGQSGSTGSSCTSFLDGNSFVFTSEIPLLPGQGMTIVLGFPKEIVSVLEPKIINTWFQDLLTKILSIAVVIGAILWYLILPFYIVIRWFQVGRDPKPPIGVAHAWFDVPKTSSLRPLTPGETGTLVDESVDMRDITATIVDLARRGYIKIVETKKNDFTLEKKGDSGKNDILEPFERLLYDGIFEDGESVRIKDTDLIVTVTKTKKALYDSVVKEKFFDKNPEATRTVYTVFGVFGIVTLNFPLALAAFIFGRVMPRKTMLGSQTAAVGRSLKNFIVSQDRQFAYQAKKQLFFEKFLPYAVAFGVEKIWAERFQDIRLTKPDWYDGYGNNAFTSIYFVNALNSSMTSVVHAATPTSSSSGFSSGFSGGSVGGGGGGGGGGSW